MALELALCWVSAAVIAALVSDLWCRRSRDRARLPERSGLGDAVSLHKLKTLLLSLFQADELRRFVRMQFRDDGLSVAVSLPLRAMTPEAYACEVLLALGRHGLLGDDFFDALALERPRREGEIRRLQQELGLGGVRR